MSRFKTQDHQIEEDSTTLQTTESHPANWPYPYLVTVTVRKQLSQYERFKIWQHFTNNCDLKYSEITHRFQCNELLAYFKPF